MGIAAPTIRFLAWQHRLRPLQPPVLLLGRQHVYVTYEELVEIIKDEGLIPSPVRSADISTNIPGWEEGLRRGYTSDRAVFQALAGHDVYALDNFSGEAADFMHDLNLPIPLDLSTTLSDR